jgi:integrase
MNVRQPNYRRHSTGQARVTIGGKDYMLGKYGSDASWAEYHRIIAEWHASGRTASFRVPVEVYTVTMLIADYLKYVKSYYRENAKSEIYKLRPALKVWKELYGKTAVLDFGPQQFKAVRGTLAKENDRSRQYVNRLGQRIGQVLRWAVSEGKIPAAIADAVGMVQGLRKGKTDLRETEDVEPVPQAMVDATLPHLSFVVADMVRLQLACGARPGEICQLCPGMVKKVDDHWEVELSEHKNSWRGKSRTIYLTAEAYGILEKYLDRPDDHYCFCPREAVRQKLFERFQRRVTPMNQGNKPGSKKKRNPNWRPGDCYSTDSYRRAIHRACELAYPVPKSMKSKEEIAAWRSEHQWSPNQLRHAFGTEVRKKIGIEAAASLLGHSDISVTMNYAKLTRETAIEALRRLSK